MITKEQYNSIASMYGTPTYVYDISVVRKRINQLQSALNGYSRTKFLYAIKANYNPTIVKEIVSHNIGIDAVSIEEVHLALACGVSREDIMFTGNNMTDTEMHECVELGVLLNIGSLSRLEKYCVSYPGTNVSIRFNPNVGSASHETNITGGPHSKFGISYQHTQIVKALCASHHVTIVGIHQHIGSGWLEIEEPLMALDVILDIAKQFKGLQFVDVGGGFGVPYMPDETSLDLTTLGSQITDKVNVFVRSYGQEIELRFEPGRFFVAEAGHLLTRVNTLKKSIAGKKIVGTDTGMNHLVRPAMYGSYHSIENISNPQGDKRRYHITGNVCECADFFAKDRVLPEIRENDLLTIDVAGAYGMSMASNYQCRALPAEIVIDHGNISVARPRKSIQQFLKDLGLYN